MEEQFLTAEHTANLIWLDLISGDEARRSAAAKALAIAPESVREIVAARSNGTAQSSDSAAGPQEQDDDVDWRALDHVTI